LTVAPFRSAKLALLRIVLPAVNSAAVVVAGAPVAEAMAADAIVEIAVIVEIVAAVAGATSAVARPVFPGYAPR
jgi:sulfur carrier protein ThiS